jgi:MFS family permease
VARAYLASLNPRLPRSVQILQAGGLANAFGNGIVYPFLFIYLHNVRGFGLGTVGLVLATNGTVSLVVQPLSGPVIDRLRGPGSAGSSAG